MTVVLFEPHHDDAVLFACLTLQREMPLVVTVFGDCPDPFRWKETVYAMEFLHLESRRWSYREKQPDWDRIQADMRRLDEKHGFDVAWAPLAEDGGHEDHNAVGIIAADVFGPRLRRYATYKRGYGRTRTDTEVFAQPGEAAMKFRAMACYSSQIELPSTRPWFAADDCLREWIA